MVVVHRGVRVVVVCAAAVRGGGVRVVVVVVVCVCGGMRVWWCARGGGVHAHTLFLCEIETAMICVPQLYRPQNTNTT